MKKKIFTKEALVTELIREGVLKTEHIIAAFQGVDRRDFILPEYAGEAYGNYPLPIGFDQTISQPQTVAFMLEQLQPQPGDSVLEIGAGSGWQTALLAHIVSGKADAGAKKQWQAGKVVAMERIPALLDMAKKNIEKYHFIGNGVVEIVKGDGAKGCAAEAPYKRIIAAATAKGMLPVAWKEQLKVHGRLVAPLDHMVQVVEKYSATDFNIREYRGFTFVPLVMDDIG